MDSYFKHMKNITKVPTLINIVDDYTFKWFCCLRKVHTCNFCIYFQKR